MSSENALIAEFLEADDASRRIAIKELSRQLNQRPSAAGQILCRRPGGLYVLLPVAVARRVVEALSIRAAHASA